MRIYLHTLNQSCYIQSISPILKSPYIFCLMLISQDLEKMVPSLILRNKDPELITRTETNSQWSCWPFYILVGLPIQEILPGVVLGIPPEVSPFIAGKTNTEKSDL